MKETHGNFDLEDHFEVIKTKFPRSVKICIKSKPVDIWSVYFI